jgi:hypothetical protein
MEEMKDICFEMSIDDENIAGETLLSKSRELVKYCYKQGLLPQLVEICRKSRPHIDWMNEAVVVDDVDDTTQQHSDPFLNLFMLVRDFNRNRNETFSHQRTMKGDDIAFAMRELAPEFFNRLNASEWLQSPSPGKRLAALKYIEWLQDTDYLEPLLGGLPDERPFLQFHTLLTLYSIVDQLSSDQRKLLQDRLDKYNPEDESNKYWKQSIYDLIAST